MEDDKLSATDFFVIDRPVPYAHYENQKTILINEKTSVATHGNQM